MPQSVRSVMAGPLFALVSSTSRNGLKVHLVAKRMQNKLIKMEENHEI